ncbi:Mechanosensitive channel MscK [Halioglobus japonicus]|nr:Mechanosensitive channel MscK [Halioglobus japonicus]
MKPLGYVPLLAVVLLFLGNLHIPAAGAQNLLPGSLSGEEASEDTAAPTNLDAIARRNTEIALEQEALATELEQSGVTESSLAGKHLRRLQEKLEQIERLLEAQMSLAKALATPPESADTQLPDDEPSVFMLNVLYEQQAVAESALVEKRRNLEAAKEQLEALESRSKDARIKLKESAEDDRVRNERAARSAALAVRIQAEQVNLDALELRTAQAGVEQEDHLQARIEAIRESLASGEVEAGSALSAVMERESAVQRDRSRAERELATAELRLSAVKARYAADPEASGEALAVVDALTAYRDALAKQISIATFELERLASLREIWANWESLLRADYTAEDLASWEELANSQLSDLKQTEAVRQAQVADLQIRLAGLASRINQLPTESQARAALREAETALNKVYTELLAADRMLAADRRLTLRFADEIDAVTGKLSVLEHLSRLLQQARGFWNFEITTIDEAPFTVGSLTMGLLLFGAGLWASRAGATLVGHFSATRLKLDAGAVQAMHTLSFYVLLIAFTLLALRAVHFPLTAFTFLGGALAIGVGFGSQNVMNNFISGLILMLERPVRAQDVVEVDGSHGVIQKIGPRSTHIRATDGRHIVVPNSFFLESNVVNWTLSDDLMRTKVSVGVCYGSPTRLVKELIEAVVKAEPLALNHPPASVIFDAFADNSLNFDVYFWVEARSPMSMRDVESRIRFAIDDVFREHNLVIAFPQRDVHLDSDAPLQIQLVGGGEKGGDGSKPPFGPADRSTE